MDEIWKNIEGYEGLYQVSNLGKVRSLDRITLYLSGRKVFTHGRNLKLGYNNVGYVYVFLIKNKIKSFFLIHRLVALAFIPNVSNKPEIDHINTIRDDNRVCNLKWVTKKENRNNPNTKISNKISNKKAKRKWLEVLEKKVIQLDLNGNFIREFKSLHAIEREFGYNRANIARCCKGVKKTCYGFKWMFSGWASVLVLI
mgnify:FL=1